MRILVIEDEPRILAFLSRGLQAEGFLVDGAGDGPAGLARALDGATTSSCSISCSPGSEGWRFCASFSASGPSCPW